jgi:hypothetical protein
MVISCCFRVPGRRRARRRSAPTIHYSHPVITSELNVHRFRTGVAVAVVLTGSVFMASFKPARHLCYKLRAFDCIQPHVTSLTSILWSIAEEIRRLGGQPCQDR